MKRLGLIFCALLFAACAKVNLPDGHGGTGHDDQNPVNTLDSVNPASGNFGDANYPTQLYNSLSKERANENTEYGFGNFVYVGTQANACLGTTAAGLTHTPVSCIAYNANYRGTETGSITYPNNSTTWVAMDENTTGNNAGLPNFTRVGSTHYLIDSIDVTAPAMVADSQLLMKVVTAGGAITAVTDERNVSPYVNLAVTNLTATNITATTINTVTLNAQQYTGADWTSKIAAAIAACPVGSACTIDARTLTPGTSSTNLNVTRSGTTILLGQGTYALADNTMITVGSGLASGSEVDDVTFAGMGSGLTTISCGNTINPRGCINISNTFSPVWTAFSSTAGNAVSGSIAAGATSFTDASGVGASLVAGDRIHIYSWKAYPTTGSYDCDHCEWATVQSIAGAVVNLTAPTKQAYTATTDIVLWGLATVRIVRPTVRDMTISSATNGQIGLYMTGTEDAEVSNVNFNLTGTASTAQVAIFRSFRPYVHGCHTIEINRKWEVAETEAPTFIHNTWSGGPSVTGVDMLSLDFGTEWGVFTSNLFEQGAGMLVQSADYNVFTGNTMINSGAQDTMVMFPASGNTTIGNFMSGGRDGILYAIDPPAAWTNNHVYAAHACVRQVTNNGHFACTNTGGTSGGSEPAWDNTPGNTQPLDGTIADWIDEGTYHYTRFNSSIGDVIRNTTLRAITTGTNTTAINDVADNQISNLNTDATVTTPIYAANVPAADLTQFPDGDTLSLSGLLGGLVSAASATLKQSVIIAQKPGQFFKLECVTDLNGGACTTAPTFNVRDDTQGTTGTALTCGTSAGTVTAVETLKVAQGDELNIVRTINGGTCTVPSFSVNAKVAYP